MAGGVDAVAFLHKVGTFEADRKPRVFVCASAGAQDRAREACAQGAADSVRKPYADDAVHAALQYAGLT